VGTQANFRLDAKSVHRCTARCELRNGPRAIENGAVSVVVASEDASLVGTRKKDGISRRRKMPAFIYREYSFVRAFICKPAFQKLSDLLTRNMIQLTVDLRLHATFAFRIAG